jgi:RHS repeat-associated protein
MFLKMRWLVAGALLSAAAVPAPAPGQVIKPLDVDRDPNGVDMLSGQIDTPLPVLSIPAAPNLRFQRLQDLQPYLSGRLIPNTPGNETYDINVGRASSEHFDCNLQSDCTTKKRNGSALVAIPGMHEFTYYEGGSGREIYFNLHNGPQGPLVPSAAQFEFFPSYIRYPSGETLTFVYDTATTGDQIWRRPSSVTSTTGYTLTLTYQGNTYGQHTWRELASATIHASGSPGTPLARLTYSGDTVTDLNGRTSTCLSCTNALHASSTTRSTALRLPGPTTPGTLEPTNAMESEAQPRTYGSVTHANWVTQVRHDGVAWNYSYQAHSSQPQTRISQVSITGPNGFARTVNVLNGFNVRPRVTSIVDSQGRTTSYLYDNDVRVTRITYPEGNWAGVTYDIVGNITERRQQAKAGSGLADIVETAQFSSYAGCYLMTCFRPQWTRDALGRQTDYTWDASGEVLTRLEPADANGQRRKTINTWSMGRLIRERICLANAAGVELTCGTAAEQRRDIAYLGGTPLPLTETLTDGVGTQSLVTSYSYDSAGRPLSTDGPLPGTDDATFYRYDVHGRRTWEIGPKGANGLRIATRTEYRLSDDKPLHSERGTLPNETSTALTILSRTDLTYDSRRNPIRMAVSASGTTYTVTDQAYDDRRQLVCTAIRMNPAAFAQMPGACAHTTPGSHGPDRIAVNVYDTESRLLQEFRAYGTSLQQVHASFAYSANGKRTRVTDANGNRADLRYDGHDRQIRWVFPSPATPGAVNEADYEAYGYDATGNRTSLRRRDGSTLTFQYDALNRMTLKVVPERAGLDPTHTRDVHYGYDLGNRQLFARFDSPGGDGVTNSYDRFGRLASHSIALGGTTRTLTYEHDAGGRRTRVTHPDGVFFLYQYDAGGGPTFLSSQQGWLVNAFYNAQSLPSVISRSNNTWSGRYFDDIQRLRALDLQPIPSAHGASWSWSRNPAGQIQTMSRDNDAYASTGAYDVSRGYTVNGLNQYIAAGPATFAYDSNGNLTSDGSTSFVYDVENRLVSATGARNASLAYDPLGRLWQVSGPSGMTRFLHDGAALVAEYDSAGSMLRRYAHWVGADAPAVEYVGSGIADPRHLLANHQGSIVAATGAGAAMLFRNGYDEWGIPNATNQGRFQYTGQAWLAELGMYHYKARLYSPTLGRFLQIDPVGYDGGMNLYAYVLNDPTNLVDFSGQAPGDPFLNPRDAAIDWQNSYNPASVSRNLEYHGAVYKRGDFYYSTRAVVMGAQGGDARLRLPRDGDVRVEDLHTHGNYSRRGMGVEAGLVPTTRSSDITNADNLSEDDIKESNREGRAMTVGTPSGNYLRYDPATGQTETIRPSRPQTAPISGSRIRTRPPPRPRPNQPRPRGGGSCDGRSAGSCGGELEIWN